jgi:hypothetical protein
LVERAAENRKVGGSIPSLPTTNRASLALRSTKGLSKRVAALLAGQVRLGGPAPTRPPSGWSAGSTASHTAGWFGPELSLLRGTPVV